MVVETRQKLRGVGVGERRGVGVNTFGMNKRRLPGVAAVAGLVVVCAPVSGQFHNLVTNDDGSVVYFSSSLRMRGTEQLTHAKLFVADGGGVRLHTEREKRSLSVPESAWPVSTYYSVEGASLNGDGSVVGVVARRDCYGGSGCIPVPKFRTDIGDREFTGAMHLSRNGRFGVVLTDGSLTPRIVLLDLSSNERLEWIESTYTPTRYGRRRVTSGGTALLLKPSELRLVRFDGSTSLPLPERPLEAVIDDDGTAIVYEAAAEGSAGRRLVLVDVATGAGRALATSAMPMQPCLSNDGRVAVFLGSAEAAGLAQMYVIHGDGTGLRKLTQDLSGISSMVLSGDGKVAYAVSGAGRLLRLEVESGAMEQIVGRSMEVTAPAGSTARAIPGSAFTITGSGFADAVESAAPPLPRALNGLELLLDGRPLPLQTVAPTRVVFQIPWEVTAGKHRLEAVTEANAVFETEPVEMEIPRDAFPQFELLGEAYRQSPVGLPNALAAHEDFSGLVTGDNRARPGELIHLYMTGLGPVEPAVETGAPAPSHPPARLRLPLSCFFVPRDSGALRHPAEVLFAGLAPGFAGYYQVTIRIPAEGNLYGDSLMGCGLPNPGGVASAWISLVER